MTAAHEFLIDGLVAWPAISCSQVRADNESVMVDLQLTRGGLVAIEAVDPVFRVGGHLILVNNGVLKSDMTLGALARGAYKICCRLFGFHLRSSTVEQEGRYDKRKCDNHRDKYGTE